ncbi:MAG: hypothetical protein M1297_05080 [Nitrospirae bacterium]|jgi:hypothetical protein|nr:hypothetical protein [Nitrospirota bacterium]
MQKHSLILWPTLLVSLFLAACSHHDKGAKATAAGNSGASKSAVAPEIHHHKTVLILLDKTASVKDQNTVFSEAIRKIVDSLGAGDKFRLALITGESDADFDFVASLDLPKPPPYNPLETNEAVYKDTLAQQQDDRKKKVSELFQKVDAALKAKPTAQSTDLFGAIYASSLFFDRVKDQKILVILSDMIEEDANWRFNHVRWNDHLRSVILTHEKKLGLIPDMKGICVYVVGAKAPSLEMLQNIRFFWTQYFLQAHAGFSPDRYAHTMLYWPPPSSCSDASGRNI